LITRKRAAVERVGSNSALAENAATKNSDVRAVRRVSRRHQLWRGHPDRSRHRRVRPAEEGRRICGARLTQLLERLAGAPAPD
jgi:hypothetical protein